jgi:hypothetical protein
LHCIVVLSLASGITGAQTETPGAVIHPYQEVRINLRLRTADSTASHATLAAALETIFDNPEVCCGKDSALEDIVLSADPHSPKDLSAKLQGRHVLSDGRPIMVTAEYLPGESVQSYQIVDALLHKQPLLLQWNSHWYVLCGAIFDETLYSTGNRYYVIRHLLLLDPRFAGSRAEVVFDRQKDDWAKVQGLLLVKAEKQ